ncbi:MAG: T9SS type A sorting domain-containing protein [Ignavibacteriales bacterium]|nr:T9SS type A sorting domain-containing protein [Ignavibacteriales bacterium]
MWILIFLVLKVDIYSQLGGTVTVGSPGGTYSTLTATDGVFNAINTQGLSGDLTISIVGNTVETGAVSLSAIASGYSVRIVPASASTVTLSGSNITTVAMITLNGVDDVTIDGSIAGSGRYLVFSNYHTTTGSTTPVITFQEDARRNTIKNAVFRSNSSVLANGMIRFSTTTQGYGNDSNTVTGCKFEGVSPTRYFTAIYNSSTLTGLARNSNIRVTKNEFTKFSAASTSVVDFATAGVGDSIAIDSNYIYDDTIHTAALTCINFSSVTSMRNSISYNSIGGASTDRSGTALRVNAAQQTRGIRVTVSTAQPTIVRGNQFSNYAGIATGTNNAVFAIDGVGRLEIYENTIGGGANSWDTVMNAYDNGMINYTGAATDTANIYNNIIGNVSYRRRSNDRLAGINIGGGFRVNVFSNVIRNLKSNAQGNSPSFNLFGLRTVASTANHIVNIYNNQIYSLFQFSDTINANAFSAIQNNNNTSTGKTNIYNNKIWDLTTTHPGTGANAMVINGINNLGTTETNAIYNNSISIAGQNGTEAIVRGIAVGVLNTAVNTYSYNSVYVGGTATGSTSVSAAFARVLNGKVVVKNNIFYSDRTGALGSNAISVTAATNWADSSSDYNLLIGPTANNIGVYASVTTGLNFATWKDSSKGDKNSLSESSTSIPATTLWTDPTSGDLTLKTSLSSVWYAFGQGTPVTFPGVGTDFSGNTRSASIATGPTTIGCYEVVTPSIQPPGVVNTIIDTGSYNFALGGKKFATVTIGLPTSGFNFDLTMWHFAGKTPPNAGSTQYAKRYDSLAVTSNTPSNLTFDLNQYNFANQAYSISEVTSTRIARTTDNGTVWNLQLLNGSYTPGTPGNASATLLNNTGVFALTSLDAPLPVELSVFTVQVKDKNVLLSWTTQTEVNTAKFDVERKAAGKNSWEKAGQVIANGNSNIARQYNFTDKNLNAGKYQYRLKIVDNDGSYEYSKIASADFGVPKTFAVSQNYPNPFNPSTKIDYQLPFDGFVKMQLYSISGELIAELFSGDVQAGYHSFEFHPNGSGHNLSSGVYLYRISASDKTTGNKMQSTKKMVYMK